MNILVIGGAGYIGSHFVKLLLQQNINVVVLDNLSRGHKEAVPKFANFINADILDYQKLLEVFPQIKVDAIVHFAAFAYVGESVENPSIYYTNNVVGSLNLIKAAVENKIKKFVFSSTCSVYGNPDNIPILETESTKPINPYAETKLTIEHILRDFDTAYNLKYVALRYFNAAGASFDSSIGESHNPEPHLIPLVLKTAMGEREKIFVFGDDYNTPDGTCIRDYIHVNDLADAHLKAIEYLNRIKKSDVFNLGTGIGNSVKEVIQVSEKVTNCKMNFEVVSRRAGDPAILVADNTKAKKVLGWKPQYDLNDIIDSAYKWHKDQKF
ncbi:UDP-glucose 4-epimerase [bacterium BMS3Abin04]|nr:UDP-glucose 4-epimerase [bacterium BMS3Abin04]